MIERLLNILYDFSPNPNAGAWEQKVWTGDEKVKKFKRDLRELFKKGKIKHWFFIRRIVKERNLLLVNSCKGFLCCKKAIDKWTTICYNVFI